MTSIDFKTTQTITKSNRKNKNILKFGSVHENNEIIDQVLDKILDNNHIYMELAMQIIPSDKTVRTNTIAELIEFNLQSLITQAKKKENN